jgi:hypothetical protein
MPSLKRKRPPSSEALIVIQEWHARGQKCSLVLFREIWHAWHHSRANQLARSTALAGSHGRRSLYSLRHQDLRRSAFDDSDVLKMGCIRSNGFRPTAQSGASHARSKALRARWRPFSQVSPRASAKSRGKQDEERQAQEVEREWVRWTKAPRGFPNLRLSATGCVSSGSATVPFLPLFSLAVEG